MKIPTPIHGWRLFAGEVGVIVLGVLLALGAQQFVETLQIRSDLREFRKTIDREIGMTLFTYDFREKQMNCERARLNGIEAWLDGSRGRTDVEAIYPRGITSAAPYRSAWDSRDAETFRRLPADIRSKYALFYDNVALQAKLTERQGDIWRELLPFSEAGPLNLQERRAIRSSLRTLSGMIEIDKFNMAEAKKMARELGIRMEMPPDLPASAVARILSQCASISEPYAPLLPPKS